MTISGFFWGTKGAKIVTVICGAIAAAFGAITAAHTAWPIVDPYVLAHRGYVVEQVGGVQATTNELLMWKSEDTKNKIQSEISGWTIQLQKEPDPQTRSLIQQRVRQLDVEQQQIDERIRKLRGQ
jgi:hypothetical protein